MRIHIGCEMSFDFPQEAPLIAMLNVHYSRASDLERPDFLTSTPSVPIQSYRDSFGNWCNRLVAPPGRFTFGTDAIIRDPGSFEMGDLSAWQHEVRDLPSDTLLFLLPSRYCESDVLANDVWRLFGHTPLGVPRVQAVCDFVHNHIVFDYGNARPTRTAAEAYREQSGVCRDFAHLAVAFCRALNIPTRYCTGYISDIGLPKPWASMDFAAWMEVYLGGRWHAFDPRNNAPRIGRILIASGRDAADVPLTHIFGPGTLADFKVWTDEAVE
ncbi:MULTISPECIES: transglutaminase family protein [unclassified Mesorhizobium]|uniref:transglutaminase-like domain-containing protein n=1 Tax=unclassified Mesorhizobium TaxID=325217 RepID=UPI0011269440|nr:MULTISPECIES: transglutaminase family protein [unclassified Mesorhizobium]TPK95476.1 transglutaminase family protein [Mesorhizobium sp. B2-4-16]TPL72491.1 transglutaminase family protein [Mesorhizobium sp. B2-4-3]